MEVKQNELFKIYGLDDIISSHKIKMVRHQDSSISNFDKIISNEKIFIEYQSYQKKDLFKGCKYILSYIAYGKSNSLFNGIYEIESTKYIENHNVSKNLYELGHEKIFTGFNYKIKKVDILKELENRLVINWGKSAIVWHQWLNDKNNKEVIEIRPKGYFKEFKGYLDVLLSYKELEFIVSNIEANKTWFDKLSSIHAIYLILDTKTGNQYIGSASGNKGLWGRWEGYAKTIHGGNIGLVELIKNEGDDYKYNLQYSILHVLSASKSSDIFFYESLYKKKLGSKVFGLNMN